MPCKICKRFLSGVLWPAGRTPFKFVGDTRNAMAKEEGRKQIPAMLKFNIQWIYSLFLLKHPPPLISIIEWCSMGRRGRPSNTLKGWGRYYTENIPSLVSFNIIFDKKKTKSNCFCKHQKNKNCGQQKQRRLLSRISNRSQGDCPTQ